MHPKTNGSYPPRRLTERFIEQLKFTDRAYNVRDKAVVGLLVAVNKHTKSYKIQRDLRKNGKPRTIKRTLGRTDQMSLAQARATAQGLLSQIQQGIDINAADRPNNGIWTVAQMFAEYIADLGRRDCSPHTSRAVRVQLERYLSDWKEVPIDRVTRAMARARHVYITENNGPTTANHVLGSFGTAYRFALRVLDEPLPVNPITAVTFNRKRSKGRVIMPEDLADWWRRVQELPNPLRREMHTLGLLSGLRPGTLVSLRREWIRLDDRCISIPRMKSGRSFDLPLSEHMVQIVRRALTAGDLLHAGSPWLFPTRKRDGSIAHVQVWKERGVPETGHILRHTWRTTAARIGLDTVDARLLLDHTVPGIDGVYVHAEALFTRLLEAQERMSAAILELLGADQSASSS
jgi:integrase